MSDWDTKKAADCVDFDCGSVPASGAPPTDAWGKRVAAELLVMASLKEEAKA